MNPLPSEEYVEQAYLFRTVAERLGRSESLQDILKHVREEVLATTHLPYAIDYLRAELNHGGVMAGAMRKLAHYFAPFQTFLVASAEDDRSRFDLRMGLQALHFEVGLRAANPTPATLFFFQFETLCRCRLDYDKGLGAMMLDPFFDPAWQSWIRMVRRQVGLIDLAVYTIAVSPDFACDHMVFAGTESGVFRSSSGGRGWKETSFPMDAAPVLSLTLSAGGLLYAGTETHGLFVSDDFGATWHGLKTDAPSTPIHAIHVTTEPAPILFVLLEDSLMWSTDAGSSWRRSQASARFIHSAITMSAHPIDRGSVLVGFASGEIVTFTP